jgi:hypothetical protein
MRCAAGTLGLGEASPAGERALRASVTTYGGPEKRRIRGWNAEGQVTLSFNRAAGNRAVAWGLVGVAQQLHPDRVVGATVFQGGFQSLPGVRIDANREHLGMQEPALVVLLPGHFNPARQNRTLEARAVQTFAKHFAGAEEVCIRQRVGL